MLARSAKREAASPRGEADQANAQRAFAPPSGLAMDGEPWL